MIPLHMTALYICVYSLSEYRSLMDNTLHAYKSILITKASILLTRTWTDCVSIDIFTSLGTSHGFDFSLLTHSQVRTGRPWLLCNMISYLFLNCSIVMLNLNN